MIKNICPNKLIALKVERSRNHRLNYMWWYYWLDYFNVRLSWLRRSVISVSKLQRADCSALSNIKGVK